MTTIHYTEMFVFSHKRHTLAHNRGRYAVHDIREHCSCKGVSYWLISREWEFTRVMKHVLVIPRLHDTAGCQTGVQPV